MVYKLWWHSNRHGNQCVKYGSRNFAVFSLTPETPLPEGEGRKKIPENFCFSTYPARETLGFKSGK